MGSEPRSPYLLLIDTLLEVCRALRGGAYQVHRGPIDWSNYPFDSTANGRAIAVMVDDANPFRSSGINDANLSVEIFGRMPTVRAGELATIDDRLMDQFQEDAVAIVDRLQQTRDASGVNPIVYKVRRASARLIEAHDVSLLVQGVIATFNVDF